MTTHTWFYSLQEPLSESMAKALSQDFRDFLNSWKTHGKPVSARIEIRYNRFIIVQSDPNDDRPSGCSIDSMKRTVEEILSQSGVEWVDASWIFYRDASGEIQKANFRDIPRLVNDGSLTPETLVFDHSLGQTDDLNRWELPLSDTWLNRYFSTRQRT